jgi:hypothetical protein
MVLVIALAGLARVAAAPPSDPDDAGAWYRDAIDQHAAIARSGTARARERDARLLDACLAEGLDWAVDGEPPPVPPALRDQLARRQPVLALVRRASAAPRCDLGPIAPSGLATPTEDHAALVALARVAVADTLVRLRAGDADGAWRRLADIYRMAAHAGEARRADLGADLFDLADAVARAAVDRGLVDAEGAEIIARALAGVDPARPLGFAATIAAESDAISAWSRDRFTGADGVRRFLDEHGPRMADPVLHAAFSVMRPAELGRAVEAYETLVDRVVHAFAIEDPDEARMVMRELEWQTRRGDHGHLVLFLEPGFARRHHRQVVLAETLAARQHELRALAHGWVAPHELANAAVWYERAIARLERLDPDHRAVIRDYAADPSPPVDEGLAPALAAADPIMTDLRRAARLERCAFAAPPRDRPAASTPHHAPLRELTGLVHARALRAMARHDLDEVVATASVAYRLAGHLVADGRITSSVLADDVFRSTHRLLGPGLEAGVFSLEQRMEVLGAARRVGYRDPFGYEAAIERDRGRLERWIGRAARRAPAGAAFRLDAALDQCDGDEVLFLLLAAELIDTGVELDRGVLDHLVPTRVVASVRQRVPQVRVLLEDLEVAALVPPATPPMEQVDERRSAARRHVGATLVALRDGNVPDEHRRANGPPR